MARQEGLAPQTRLDNLPRLHAEILDAPLPAEFASLLARLEAACAAARKPPVKDGE